MIAAYRRRREREMKYQVGVPLFARMSGDSAGRRIPERRPASSKGKSPRGALLRLLMAGLLALSALGVSDSAEATSHCNTPSLTGRTVAWTGTLTIGQTQANMVTFYGFFRWLGTVYGDLSAGRSFSIGPNSYEVRGPLLWMYLGNPSHARHQRLQFQLDKVLTQADESKLQLHVCDTTFPFSDANVNASNAQYEWLRSGLDWSTLTTLTLRLSVPEPQDDANLIGLALNPGTLNPAFDTATTSYTAGVESSVSQVTVTPTTSDSNASVSYLDVNDNALTDADPDAANFQVALSTGANVVKVEVTAEDGTTTKTYTLTITRPPSDANLSGLTLSPGTLNPAFDTATTSYTAGVENGVSQVTVTPTTSNSNASVSYLDVNDDALTDADPGAANFQVALSTGANVVKVKVTAEDGTTTKTYTLTITRSTLQPNDANLSGLAISPGTLNPAFDSATTNYTAGVASGVTRVTVTPTTSNSNASVSYLDALTDADPNTAGFQVALSTGANVVKVKVTARDGTTTKTYTLTITRPTLQPNDASLSGLAISPGTLNPAFDSTTTDYTAVVESSVSHVTVTSSTNDSAASVKYLDRNDQELTDADPKTDGFQVMLAPGPYLVRVRVTAEDGATTTIYVLKVIRGTTAPPPAAGSPGPPRNLRGAGGEERVTLVWDAPESDGGSPIARYEYDVDGSGNWTSAGAALTATVTGLVNEQTYEFRVRAVNPLGEGLAARVRAVAGQLDRPTQGWLARFTREASEHVSDAIAERLRGASSGMVLGGQNLPLGEKASARGEPNADTAGTASLLQTGPAFPLAGHDTRLLGGGTLERALNERTGEDLGRPWRQLRMSEALLASSFHLASAENMDFGSRWSIWGRGARSNFDGREGEFSLHGEVTTATLGADFEFGKTLLGVALSRSEADGTSLKRGACPDCEDSAESVLTGLYPYLGYRPSERLSLWGALGMGEGELRLRPDGRAVSIETDVETRLLAAGARWVLVSPAAADEFELAVRADSLLATARSVKAPGLPEIEADAMRVRLLIDGSHSFRTGDHVFTPSVEVGFRHEAGDAEQGSGLEVGATLRYAAKRLMVELGSHALVNHQESDYEKWGVSGSVRYAPGADERGLSASLGSAWGADTGGAARLWTQASGFSDGSFEPEATLEAEVGYGFDAERGLLTPYTGLAVSKNAETWRAGVRWRIASAFEASAEANLTESGRDDKPQSGVLLRGSMRW